MKMILRFILTPALLALLSITTSAAPRALTLSQSADAVEAYDFVEASIRVEGADAANPFTDVTIAGAFGKTGETVRTAVTGFCDSNDGGVYRIRFMPSTPGEYAYSATYR